MMDEEEIIYAENEFQISKDQYNFNKNQKGWLLKHQQAVNFNPKEYNEDQIKYLKQEYDIKSEHARQAFGNQQMNTIRHKKNKDGVIESNAKIVEWDDGSLHLMIGDQFYRLNLKDFTGEICSLYERPSDVNQNSYLTDQLVPQTTVDKIGAILKLNNK